MITNYSASIYRSLLLFIYIVLNKKLDLRISTVNVLLLVVCTLLIFNPLIIYDMGFLYSPTCVAAWKLVKSEIGRKAAIQAADQLISRFQSKGNFIQAWGELGAKDNYRYIVDLVYQ